MPFIDMHRADTGGLKTVSKKYLTAAAFSFLILFAAFLAISCLKDAEEHPAEEKARSTEPTTEEKPPFDGVNNNTSAVEPEEEEKETEVEQMKIGVYSGEGSWEVNIRAANNFLDHHELQWSSFDRENLENLNLNEHFDLIWFPGGFAAEYKNYITDHENIRSFVEEGGAFVGTCAGAYYAADILKWHGSDYEYPLKLFDGRAIGPLAGLVAWGDTAAVELENKHPANKGFDRSLDMYYFDGPYFEPYEDISVEVLARYEVNAEPAVIAGRYGSGKFFLKGPHPEMGGISANSQDYDSEGGRGAQWPWLYSALSWFAAW